MAAEVKLALCIERIDTLQETLTAHVSETAREIKDIKKEVRAINRTLLGYKGTLGGIVLSLSAVATIIAILWNWLTGKFG